MKIFPWFFTIGFLLFPVFGTDQAVSNEINQAVNDASESQTEENSLDGAYLVLGLGGSFYKSDINVNKTYSCHTNRLLGIFAFGGGRVFGDTFYLGAEALCDFSKTKEKILNIDGNNAAIKISQLTPSLGVRLGYYNGRDTMFYTKVIASRINANLKYIDHNKKHTKISPAIVLGVEQAFSKKFSARLECEYRFNSCETFLMRDIKHNGKFKIARGTNVRALVAYHLGTAR
ncbi:MAG: outer membrane beta-barrel protein [Holosporaceae bacterium]|nr:outer membrane beta-barrel protein [Holosporaceae bacterium]